MTEIVYSTERVPDKDGRVLKNPRHFLAPIVDVKRVYLADGWPVIRSAYEALGVEVLPLGSLPQPKPSKKPSPAPNGDTPTT